MQKGLNKIQSFQILLLNDDDDKGLNGVYQLRSPLIRLTKSSNK